MIFKIWKWKIDFNVSRMDADEKIGYLANELIKAMQGAGKQVALPDINEGFGSIDINVHRIGKENSTGYVSYQSGRHSIKFTPDFGELKVF